MRSIQIFLGIAGFACSALAQLPPGVMPCRRTGNDQEYNQCVLEQIKVITPQLFMGLPSLKLPPLDPFELPSLTVNRNLQSARIRANFTNIEVFGLTNYILNELDVKPDDLTVHLKLSFPAVHAKGRYKVRGSVLFVPIYGVGSFSGNFSNIDTGVDAQGEVIVDKQGIRRIAVRKLVPRIYIDDGSIKLDAQGPPSQVQTARTAMRVFNGNPRNILNMINPAIEETLTSLVKVLMARVFSVLSADDILP